MQNDMRQSRIEFQAYGPGDMPACMNLFDANCPSFFAPNERAEFESFLADLPMGYQLCLHDGSIVGAFGITAEEKGPRTRLNWIMLEPSAQGHGVGSAMMKKTVAMAAAADAAHIDIAASQRSADFFAHFGAVETQRTADGWGPGMDRVDMVLQVSAATPEQAGT